MSAFPHLPRRAKTDLRVAELFGIILSADLVNNIRVLLISALAAEEETSWTALRQLLSFH